MGCCGCDGWDDGSGSGATTFLGLTDTPASYAGASLFGVRVNAAETGLEFFAIAGGGTLQDAYDAGTGTITSDAGHGPFQFLGTEAFSVTVDGNVAIASGGSVDLTAVAAPATLRTNGAGAVTAIAQGTGDATLEATGGNAFVTAGGNLQASAGGSVDLTATGAPATLRTNGAGAATLAAQGTGNAVVQSTGGNAQIGGVAVEVLDGAGAVLYELPVVAGTSGQVLTKGAGNVSTWATPAGGGSDLEATLIAGNQTNGQNILQNGGYFATGTGSTPGTGDIRFRKNSGSITRWDVFATDILAWDNVTMTFGDFGQKVLYRAAGGGHKFTLNTGDILNLEASASFLNTSPLAVHANPGTPTNTAINWLATATDPIGEASAWTLKGRENNSGVSSGTGGPMIIEGGDGVGARDGGRAELRGGAGVALGGDVALTPGAGATDGKVLVRNSALATLYELPTTAGNSGEVLTKGAGDTSSWQPAGGGGSAKIVVRASLQGQASNTNGLLQIFNINTGNPGGVLEQTNSAEPGINNGGIAPMYLPACTLTKAGLSVAKCAVSQGTTGGAMAARFELFDADYSSRSLLSTLDFPITSAGVFSNLGGNNLQKGIVLSPSVAITEGTLFGAQFTSRSANNNEINGMGGIYLYLEFTL